MIPGDARDSVHGLVDHLFRREAGRMVAALTHSFGPAHLALAEEVVQEALGPIYQEFVKVKEQEWADYHRQVTEWEIDRYLTMF